MTIDPQPILLFVTFGVLAVVGFTVLFGAVIGFCALLGAMYSPEVPLPDEKIDSMLQKMNGDSRWRKQQQ